MNNPFLVTLIFEVILFIVLFIALSVRFDDVDKKLNELKKLIESPQEEHPDE
jgi:hypothetical protein